MAMAAPGRVVVVGSFNVDHVWHCDALPRAGETLAGRYASGPGGKGFNQAIAARRAGADTAFVCALGDDAGGTLARELAATDGVELRVQASAAPTGSAGIFVDAQGRNCIVVGAGANATLDQDAIDAAAECVGDARVLLAQMETPPATVRAALLRARDAQATTILNPAPADANVDAALLALADILTPNETELAALCMRHLAQSPEADALAAMTDRALHALCRRLLPHGTVVVTLGAGGCFVSHAEAMRRGDGRPCYRLPAERVEAVDTTGAGDAFNGALAASMAAAGAGRFESHARFASRYAALSVERPGAALAMPALEEVARRFEDR
jgi:ribokinase